MIETLGYIETDIDKSINTTPYLSLNLNKVNEYELEDYRAENYDNLIALGFIEEDF